jgi:hypothetical protein
MPRAIPTLLATILLLGGAARGVRAEEKTPAVASLEDAKQALAAFEVAFKASGSKGDEKTAVQEKAMRELAKVQHPLVADRLAKITKNQDKDLRTLAVMYLGEQVAMPGYAGKAVLDALKRNLGDYVYLMVSGDSIESLGYRGQLVVLRDMLAHKDEAVRKNALQVIGGMKEVRMIDDVLKLMIDLKIDKGAKWEGGEVSVDTGAPGDADQRAAEAAYAERYGKNEQKGKSAGRKMRDMKPLLLDTMKKLTGQEFLHTQQAEDWIAAHKAEIDAQKKAFDELQRSQEEAAKAHAEAAKG